MTSSPPDGRTPQEHRHEEADPRRSSLVPKADAVLEEELRGRSSPDNDQMQVNVSPIPMDLESTLDLLLQRDTDFAGTLMKVLKQRPEQLTQIASQLANTEQLPHGNDVPPFPLLKISSPVNAGNAGQIMFSLINDGDNETADYPLHSTDLVGLEGHRIPASYINISPNISTIPPGESVDGQIEIRVPRGTPPGTYAGLLKTEDISQLMTIVQLTVAPLSRDNKWAQGNESEDLEPHDVALWEKGIN